jgi:hypothetical protein
MAIKKEDFLTLASELKLGATETHWRSAVSRAYYAAYHGCHDWHAALPVPGSNAGRGGGIHQELINRLHNPDPSLNTESRKLSKMLAAQLDVLRGHRGLADYRLPEVVDSVLAANSCTLAQAILQRL